MSSKKVKFSILQMSGKSVYQMQCELRKAMVYFILLCNVRNMLKYAFKL